MNQTTHYFVPERMARTIGNLKACCARPEAEHPTFAEGTTVTVELIRPLKGLRGKVYPKGLRLVATRETLPTIRIVSESRWGAHPVDGRFCELEKAVVEDVRIPSWSVKLPGDEWRTAIWTKQAREVAA